MAWNKEPLPYKDTQRHHIIFNRYLWTASEDLKKLRNTKELIVPLKIPVHKDLHRAIEQVPVPDHHMIKRINSEFYPARNDPIQTVRNLQESIECALESPYTSELAYKLGQIIISSLEIQIPYLERGMIND